MVNVFQQKNVVKVQIACPESCDYMPEICTLQCVAGCFCDSGYVRQDNSTNSPCIEQNKC